MQASDEYVVEHKADNSDIVLFLFKGSSVIAGAKKKVCLLVWFVCLSVSMLSGLQVGRYCTKLCVLCSKTTWRYVLTNPRSLVLRCDSLEVEILLKRAYRNHWHFPHKQGLVGCYLYFTFLFISNLSILLHFRLIMLCRIQHRFDDKILA